MQSEQTLRKEICEIGRRAFLAGFCPANDGNLSVRLSDGTFLCTPTGVGKGFMTPDMLCVSDETGKLLKCDGALGLTSEMAMHLRVYKERPEINAVVHTHAPHATCFAIMGIPLDNPVMPEAAINFGAVPVAPFATPGTAEVPESIAGLIQKHDAVLIANHGVLTCGKTLTEAWFKMESVEAYAKILTILKTMGEPKPLTREQLQKIKARWPQAKIE